MNKRGQLTVFIIIAVLVVAIVAVVFLVSPGLRGPRAPTAGAESPENFIQICLEDTIKKNVELIASQGGSLEPEFSYMYQGSELQYLCHTGDVYVPCTIQIPFLRNHIENEIEKSIEDEVGSCFNSLREEYRDSSVTRGDLIVELLPGRISTTINNEFVFTEAGQTERRESFSVILNNNLYELSAIAQNIVGLEVTLGEADVDRYMDIYPWLRAEKYPQTDETNVYILTNKDTGDKLQFASRSFAF